VAAAVAVRKRPGSRADHKLFEIAFAKLIAAPVVMGGRGNTTQHAA
jgi:hypothetical protein